MNILIDESKKKAESALATTSGRKYSIREFKNEASKRIGVIETPFEEKTLDEERLYNQVGEVYSNKIAKIKDLKIYAGE